jgi:hypothetical protein
MTNSHDTSDSFVSAWSKASFPDGNFAFVKHFCAEIGIKKFEFKPASYRYIQAIRRDGTGELRIHWGCTTGFTEAEARRFGVGADEVRPATTQGTTWLVSHPEHRDVSLRGGNSSGKKTEPQRCPECGIYELSVTGVCPGCHDD